MPTESIVFAPELDERQLDNETDKVNEELQQVGQGIPVEFEGDMQGLADGLDVPGGAGAAGGGIGAGGAASIGSMAAKIPKPVAGVGAAAALPVALSGGVGFGMLNAMSDASARLQTSSSILQQASNNVWRPLGDRLDELLVRDAVLGVRDETQAFNEQFREGQEGGAFATLFTGRTPREREQSGPLRSGATLSGAFQGFLTGGFLGGAIGSRIGDAVGEELEEQSSARSIANSLKDALPTTSAVTASTALPVSLSGATGLAVAANQEGLKNELGIISDVMQFAEANLWEPLSGATDDITNFFADPASLIGFDGSGESPFADLDISESDILDDVFDTVTNSNLVSSVFDTVTSNSLVNSVFNTVGSNTLVGTVFNTVTSSTLVGSVFNTVSSGQVTQTVFSRVNNSQVLDRLFSKIPTPNIIDSVFPTVSSSSILSIFPDPSLPDDFWPEIPTPSFDVDPPELPDNFWPEVSLPSDFWPDLAPDDVDFDIPVPEDLWPELSLPSGFWPDISFPDNLWPDLSVPNDFWPDMAVPDIDIPRAELPDNFWPDVDAPELDIPDFPGWPDLELPDNFWPELSVPDNFWPDLSLNPLSSTSTNTVSTQSIEPPSSGRDNRDILRQIESNTRSDAQSSQNLATIESQLSQLQSEVKRLRSAMDVTVQVGREEIARATQEGRQNGTTDTDPTV